MKMLREGGDRLYNLIVCFTQCVPYFSKKFFSIADLFAARYL